MRGRGIFDQFLIVYVKKELFEEKTFLIPLDPDDDGYGSEGPLLFTIE